jgi:hypothetical protein
VGGVLRGEQRNVISGLITLTNFVRTFRAEAKNGVSE